MGQQYETDSERRPPLQLEPDAMPESLTGRYQVRLLQGRRDRPHVIVDTLDSDRIIDRAGEPEPGYRSYVAAQTAADRLNRASEDDTRTAASQLAEDLERAGVARVPHAHHFPVRRMMEDGPVMGDCECGMTFEQWEDARDYD